MATYIPGAEDFVPQLDTFTPNYKFLQDVLEVRQDRYTSNYNLLNDLWGDVVYADLGREDNREVRDQYSNKLSEKMKQVSGMDLSLQQNIEAARGLFKPFYENKNIVGDLARTKQYKKEQQRMNTYKTNPQEFERKKFWQDGEKYMNYMYQDFIEADPSKALGKPFPTYIENPNIIDRSIDLLKEKGLSIERTTIEGDYFLTQTGGNLLLNQIDTYDPEKDTYTTRNPAKAMLKNLLAQDPLIMRALAAQAEVRAREFAEDPGNLQKYGSKEGAMAGWAKDVMDISLDQQTIEVAETNTWIEQMANDSESWEKYQKKYKLTPAEVEVFNKKINDLKMLRDANKTAQKSIVNQKGPADNQNLLMSKAYESYMRMKLDEKLTEAAKEYADLGAKTEIKHDPIALARNKHNWNMSRDWQKHLYKLDEIKARGKGKESTTGNGNGWDILNPDGVTVFSSETTGGEIDKSILDGTGYFEYVNTYFDGQEKELDNEMWAYIEGSYLGSNAIKGMFNHLSDSPQIIDNTKIAYTIDGKEFFTDLKTAKNNLVGEDGNKELNRIFDLVMKKRQSLEVNNANSPVPKDALTAQDSELQTWMVSMEESVQDREALIEEGVNMYYDAIMNNTNYVFQTDPDWKADNERYHFPNLAMPEGVIKLLSNSDFGLLMDDPTDTKANVSWKEFLKDPKKFGINDPNLSIEEILSTPVRKLSKEEWIDIYMSQAKGGNQFGQWLNNSPETKNPGGMNGTSGENYANARKDRDQIPELAGIRGEFWKLNENYNLYPPRDGGGMNYLMNQYANSIANDETAREMEFQRSLIGYYQFDEASARQAAEADWEVLNERINKSMTSTAAGGDTGTPTFDPVAYFTGVPQEGSGLNIPKQYEVSFNAKDNPNPTSLNEMRNILGNLSSYNDQIIVQFGNDVLNFPENLTSNARAKEIALDLISKHKNGLKDKTEGRLDYTLRYVETIQSEEAMEANPDNNGYAAYVIDFGDSYAAKHYLGANKILNASDDAVDTDREDFMSAGNSMTIFIPKQYDNSVFSSQANTPDAWAVRLEANGSIEQIVQNGGKYKLFEDSSGQKMIEMTPMFYNAQTGNMEWADSYVEVIGIDDYNIKKLLAGYRDRLGTVADNNIKNRNQSSKVRTPEQDQSLNTIDAFPGLPADRLQWAVAMTQKGYTWNPNTGTMMKQPVVPQN